MDRGRLPAAEWQRVQDSVPILCVDVVPVSVGRGSAKIGLIERDTPHQGLRWCLIGGRVLRNESLENAVLRQLTESIGGRVRVELPRPIEPILTTEYFTKRRGGSLHDPRKHAIGLVFVAAVSGRVRAGGEAERYRWFSMADIPAAGAFGFGQHKVLREVLRRIQVTPRSSSSAE